MEQLFYFNAQISFLVDTKSGGKKEEKTYFLVRGVTVSDVETQVHEKIEEDGGYEDFRVISVAQSRISHIIDYDESESYINAQIVYEIEKDNGDIKEKKDYYLVRASMSDCEDVIHKDLENHPESYRIASISESSITKVIDHHNNIGD